jgi:hypothetical protein
MYNKIRIAIMVVYVTVSNWVAQAQDLANTGNCHRGSLKNLHAIDLFHRKDFNTRCNIINRRNAII